MQFLDQLLSFLQRGVDEVFKFTKQIWMWAITQINHVPWDNIGAVELWKKLFLVVVAGVMIYLLYSSIRSLLEAGTKALSAIATLLGVVIQTLLPVLLAGAVAAGGAYVVNNVNF